MKQEQKTTAGPSQKELNHYTAIFTEKTTNGVVAKRILVQGDTGIGKTTFVKKLLVDWSNLDEAKMEEEQKDALRKFDLVVSINLKEVSKCQTFEEVISRSQLFPKDEEKLVDDLPRYIRANQEKVLLVFDGYDEYRTGSKAGERYGSRGKSPIFEIFRGDILRKCTVLVTTRSSRADEIRVHADIQAEITGFNMRDRKDFMAKMLDSQTEVDDLLEFLRKSNLNDLARVPLLSLFFCLLWKKEKKMMDVTKRKAKLYQAIVKHILQHSHRRKSSPMASKLKESDYDEILAEIGKVALAGLLKGDLLFEFGQLPEKVRGEEGVVVGLFQFSEYGPSLEPMEMMSFIHKSIQEYLAAWYLIYSCVPNGNLGEIGEHATTLENCEALENVFQFVCGLSDEGAMKVLEHLTSVRISDPTLDLSKKDVESETDVPLCDITYKHQRFSNLIHDCFREVQSKAGLLSHLLDSTDGVILVSLGRPLSELMPNGNILTKLGHNCVFIFDIGSFYVGYVKDTVLYKSLDFLNCLQTLIGVTESSNLLTVEDFLRKFSHDLESLCSCSFYSILRFRDGQFQFYINKLLLECDAHARVFTEFTTISRPSNSTSLCSEQSCLKFLSSLECYNLSSQTVKALGAVIGNCKHLSRIKVGGVDDSICYLLEQVRNPSKCSVTTDGYIIPAIGAHLTSAGAVQLASLLPKFNVIALHLDLRDCCVAALDTLVANITHKTLKKLILTGIILTPAGTKALGQSLPEMSSLQQLHLTGVDGSLLQAEKMETLFGGFYKAVPLCQLTFKGFSGKNCLSPLIKCLRFFPYLDELKLEGLNINEHDQCSLVKNFRFLTTLMLRIRGETGPDFFHYDRSMGYKGLYLGVISLTPVVAAMLGRLLPELSSLQVLGLTGFDGSIFQAAEMEALFGGFNKKIPLYELAFTDFSVRGRLAPLFRSLRFFPNLIKLNLENVNMDEHDLRGLVDSFQFIPDLQELDLSSNPLGHAVTSIVPHVINLKKLQYLWIDNTGHSEKDLNYVLETVQQALPDLDFGRTFLDVACRHIRRTFSVKFHMLIMEKD